MLNLWVNLEEPQGVCTVSVSAHKILSNLQWRS